MQQKTSDQCLKQLIEALITDKLWNRRLIQTHQTAQLARCGQTSVYVQMAVHHRLHATMQNSVHAFVNKWLLVRESKRSLGR